MKPTPRQKMMAAKHRALVKEETDQGRGFNPLTRTISSGFNSDEEDD
jgi:hypothetical protein